MSRPIKYACNFYNNLPFSSRFSQIFGLFNTSIIIRRAQKGLRENLCQMIMLTFRIVSNVDIHCATENLKKWPQLTLTGARYYNILANASVWIACNPITYNKSNASMLISKWTLLNSKREHVISVPSHWIEWESRVLFIRISISHFRSGFFSTDTSNISSVESGVFFFNESKLNHFVAAFIENNNNKITTKRRWNQTMSRRRRL